MNSIIGVIAIIAVTILLNIILDYFILDRDNDKGNSDLISIIKNKKKIIIYLVIAILETILLIIMGAGPIFYLYYFVVLIFYRIMLIDYKTKYINNKLFILMILIAFASLAIDNGVSIKESVITGGVSYILFALFSKATKGALGMGDANIFGLLGVIFGYQGIMGILMVSCILIFIVSAFLLIKSRANKNKELPFTPYIFASLILMLIVNNI